MEIRRPEPIRKGSDNEIRWKRVCHMARFTTLLLAIIMMLSYVCAIPNTAAREDSLGRAGIFVCGPDNAAYAAESETIIVTEKRTITDVASYDVWKHINGTWQFGKKPGSAVSESFTIYIAGRLPQNAKVTEVHGSYDDDYSGAFSTWAVPTADINIKSFNDANLTYTMDTILSGNPMDLRKATQSEYTEGYRYYIPVTFEVTYTVEKEVEVSDADKIEKDDAVTGTENNANMSGTAKLELPETIYEGHPAPAHDRSVFDVDGKTYGAARMYDEGLASNSFAVSGNGRVKRINDTEADVTFEKTGKQSVALKVKTKSGDTLTDKKYIDVLKTPMIIDTLGGVQKENRKQILSIVIAENPSYPLTELYVEIEKKGGAQRVHLEHDTNISDKGYGSNINDNSSLIKTRAIKDVGSDKNFTRVELEFLTKNNEKTEMTYRIFAKDTRGNTDKAEKDFTVMPDEAPHVIISSENPQFRDEGVNVAYLYAEDATAYDGDDADRTWYVREEIVDKESETDASAESKEMWTDWIEASESDGRLMDASFGTWRGVAYKKNGVGKVEFRLDVTEKWTEATLDEYVSDADRKKGSGSIETTVDNIAPTVSFNAEKLKRGNLVMLAQSDEEREKLTAYKADILRCLREIGISGDTVTARVKNKNELNSSDLPDTAVLLTRPYGYSAAETFLEKGWYMCDDDTLYTIDGTWTLNAGTSSIYSYAADAPYTIKAYDLNEASKLATGGGEPIEINDETQPKWQAVISKELLGGADINNIKGMSQDDMGTYLYFVSESQTLIYDKKTGTLAAAVPFAFGDDNFVSESRIYTLKADGFYSVNLRSGKINCVYRDTIAMKKSYSDQEGSAQKINGEIHFAAGKGNKLVRVCVNPVTEEVRLTDMKPSGASYASTYNVVGLGGDGILCIGRDNMSAFHVFDRDGNELINKTSFNAEREHDIVPVYKSNGKFDYIAVLYNTYRRSGTSSSGYKYRYGINASVYDIYEASSEPMEYSYERTTGSGGTSGCGHDAGKVMYAVQFGKTIVINTGNWSTCISDGSEIDSYYNTSFAQLVFDIESGASKVYKNGSSLYNALNAGGVLCEYGKLCDEYVVSAYSNVDARNTFGNGLNRQMLKIARLPKTEDAEIAEAIDKLAPIKEVAKLDSAAVYLNGYSMSGEASGSNKKLGEAASSSLTAANNELIGTVDEEIFAQEVASDMKSMLGSIGGLIVIPDDKDNTNEVKITKKYRLQPDTQYFYEMNYSGGKDMPVAVTATLNRAAGEMSADSTISNITGNSYTVTEIFEEDFSESDNTNKYFNGIVADRTADGVYHGAALNRNKDSSSGNKAVSDSSEFSFTVDKNKKAIISFDYDMNADRNNPDEVYISIDGERWYRNSGFSNSSGTYMHPHILESGEHVIEFGAKGYGKRPIETYIDIDNLRVIYIEEAKGSVGNAKNSGSYESAVGSGTDTLLEYEEGAAKGSFKTPERIVSFAGQDMKYINKIPENGSEGIMERSDTEKVKMLKINIPSDMKAVFTSVSLVSSPSAKHGVNWTFDNTNINVRKETNGNYYPMSVPNPLKMTSDKHEGSIEAKTAALYKAGAGFDAVEMVLTSSLNSSIEASKYFISPGTNEIYFEDEVFNGDVSISIAGSGEWTLSDFRLYYIENGKKVYAEDGYMDENDALGFSVEGGRIEAEDVNNAQNNTAARIYKKGEIVNYGQTYYDYENDPSKSQYWRYTHTEANDGLHPDAGKVLSAPIEKFYIDGKYNVEHWQEDSTGRLRYDKTSNTAEMTFYIEGQAAAPWIEWIKTNPSKPEAGDNMNIVIAVNDAEKDVLSLTTELYRDGKLVYTHKNLLTKVKYF